MAESNSLPFSAFVLETGDGANPEVFTAVGAFISRSLKGKLDTGSTQVPDSTNDAALMATELEGKSITFEISGDGVLNMAASSFGILNTWFLSGAAKDVRLQLNASAANGGGYYAGAAFLTDFSMDGKKAEKTTTSITLASSGYWVWVPATS